VPTLRAKQIKKTKTILRDYIYDIDGVYRSPSTAKIIAKILSVGFFAVPASTNARRRKYQEKKDDPSLAIGENYIKKIFLFFNILFMNVFTYR